jgi:hypothetical protein
MKNIKFMKYIVAMIIAAGSVASIIYAQQSKTNATEPKSETKVSCPMMAKDKSHEDCPLMREKKSESDAKNSDAKSDDHPNHADHFAKVNERGEKEMGFSQTKTTHHFLLLKDGGAIQVEVNDPKDTAAFDKIRSHLTYIAKAFTENDFETPLAVHGQIPPGVPQMKELSKTIKYEFQETPNGARVRISTNNPEALTAIYEFLRFQIKDHQTGDSLQVGN